MSQEFQVDKARAVYYNFFANFFVYSHDIKQYFGLLSMLDILIQNSLNEESHNALQSIKNKLQIDSNVKLMQEYDDIFHNPLHKNIRTTASFYDEQMESGKKRVEMINLILQTKRRRDEANFHDNEDSIGFILDFSSLLIDDFTLGETNYKKIQNELFRTILNDFIDEFLKEVFEHKSADIYKDLVVVMHSFFEFERIYLNISKPTPKAKVIKKSCDTENISEEEKQRRAKNKALKALGPKKL